MVVLLFLNEKGSLILYRMCALKATGTGHFPPFITLISSILTVKLREWISVYVFVLSVLFLLLFA